MTFTVPHRDRLIWAAVDLDGTLAVDVWPEPGIGAPIRRNVVKARELTRAGYKVVIHTARGWEHYELIEAWLNHHDIPFSRIVCGKVLAAVYVDDRAVHSDEANWTPHSRSQGSDLSAFQDAG